MIQQALPAMVLSACLAVSLARADDDALARAAWEAAGSPAGFCLHLGCGRAETPGLTAALTACSGMPVQGVALDDAALARTRKGIQDRGLAGRAMAEKAAGKSLPHPTGLARLVVVEEMAALSAAGISQEEILRVVAPGGVLCTGSGGKWVKTVKPRPPEMDEWTHPHHGPDGNLVSADRLIKFPIALRWIDGVPFDRGGFGDCASCRAVVLAGGRCFTINNDDLKSEGRALLRARDAYSGFPLWALDCQAGYGKVELDWRNTWPLAANDRRVYAGRSNDVVIADAATGRIEAVCPTKFRPRRLLLGNGVVVAASWEKMEFSNYKDGFENDQIRSVWWPKGEGSVEAFDAATGQSRWRLPLVALTIVSGDGLLYVLTHAGNPPTNREVVAVDLASGREKWRVPHTAFGEEADTCLNFAGPGCVVVSKSKAAGKRAVSILSAADGKVRVSISNTTARAIVGNELWCTQARYDLKTGQKVPGSGIGPTYAGVNVVGGCVPPIVVGGRLVCGSRSGSYTLLGDDPSKPGTALTYRGARGACIQGMVPANGMFYTAQNNCGCFAAQIGGFLGIGPADEPPAPEAFTAPRPVEKGPAFGATSGPDAAAEDWPMYRHDQERGAGTTAAVPDALVELWKVTCVKPVDGPFADAWDSRAGAPQPLTAPIIAAGSLYVAGVHSGEILALNPATGAPVWSVLLASRIDSPPTYHKGLLLVGCHDGWVYALRAKDGALSYRVRIAPAERRLVDHGVVESVWPAAGSVLVQDGLAFACAGRSSSTDGGIALVAFKAETGETVWARHLGEKTAFFGDVLSVVDKELAWHWMRLDPATGADLPPTQKFYSNGSMIDGSWTAGYTRRSGGGLSFGRVNGSMLAWNSQLVAGPGWAVPRARAEVPKPDPKAGPKHPDPFKAEEYAWKVQLEPHIEWARVYAMALSGNTAFFAGDIHNGWRNGQYDGSMLWMKSTADGKTRQKEIKLDTGPCLDGLAVAGGRVYLALRNGTLLCLGAAAPAKAE